MKSKIIFWNNFFRWFYFKVLRKSDQEEDNIYFWIYKMTPKYKLIWVWSNIHLPHWILEWRALPMALINSFLIFKFNDTLYMEKKNSDEDRYKYLDQRIYSQMKEITAVQPGTTPSLIILEDLVLLIGENLNCLAFTKKKQFGFRLWPEQNDLVRCKNSWILIMYF